MNQEIFYWLQLLFNNKKTRDATYGMEFNAPYTEERDLSLAANNEYEILHRGKGTHLTGARSFYFFPEKLHTIELVLQVPSVADLESFLQTGDYSIGKRQRVSEATLVFTANDPTFVYEHNTNSSLLESFQKELEIQAPEMTKHLQSRLSYNKIIEAYYHHLDGMFKGDIRSVLRIHDFVQKAAGVSNFGLSFS